MISLFGRVISVDARADIIACADGITLGDFLNRMWAARDLAYKVKWGEPIIRGEWPFRPISELQRIRPKLARTR